MCFTLGCLTCRQRHKRCDERLPTCVNCENNDIPCKGYGLQLRWLPKSMQTCYTPPTFYRRLQYINFNTNNFLDEFEVTMEIYSNFDVDYSVLNARDKQLLEPISRHRELSDSTASSSTVSLSASPALQSSMPRSLSHDYSYSVCSVPSINPCSWPRACPDIHKTSTPLQSSVGTADIAPPHSAQFYKIEDSAGSLTSPDNYGSHYGFIEPYSAPDTPLLGYNYRDAFVDYENSGTAGGLGHSLQIYM
ncbi:uncharacterized protein V1518DRAFT_152097 [Limtongia smithiae]|uniref:uncharacterized protein n=1 Tax=Limtongia smithiae TaxID=1125753 RepID=UPI0034CF9038